jgi:hypothetical protein
MCTKNNFNVYHANGEKLFQKFPPKKMLLMLIILENIYGLSFFLNDYLWFELASLYNYFLNIFLA